jgi:hypothetical protein
VCCDEQHGLAPTTQPFAIKLAAAALPTSHLSPSISSLMSFHHHSKSPVPSAPPSHLPLRVSLQCVIKEPNYANNQLNFTYTLTAPVVG